MANKSILFTAAGNDRPGLTASFLSVLYKHNANVEESYTKVLHGQFSMILVASFPTSVNINNLKEDLEKLEESTNFYINFQEISTKEVESVSPRQIYMINVIGADKPGIMYSVSSLLAKKQINITNTESRVIALNTNTPIYIMNFEVQIPDNMDINDFGKQLTDLAKNIEVDISIKPIEIYNL